MQKKLFVKVYTSFITKNWKQPRAPSIGDTPNGVNKLCYSHTMEPDSKIKQRNFQFINECLHNWVLFRNKDERHKSYMHIAKWKSPWKTCCLFLTIWHSRSGKTIETMKRSGASWYLGWGGVGLNQWRTGHFLGWLNHSLWEYNSGYETLYICSNA